MNINDIILNYLLLQQTRCELSVNIINYFTDISHLLVMPVFGDDLGYKIRIVVLNKDLVKIQGLNKYTLDGIRLEVRGVDVVKGLSGEDLEKKSLLVTNSHKIRSLDDVIWNYIKYQYYRYGYIAKVLLKKLSNASLIFILPTIGSRHKLVIDVCAMVREEDATKILDVDYKLKVGGYVDTRIFNSRKKRINIPVHEWTEKNTQHYFPVWKLRKIKNPKPRELGPGLEDDWEAGLLLEVPYR